MGVSGCENTPAGHQALFFRMHELSEVHGIGKFEMHHLVYEYKKSVRQDMSQHNVKSLIWRTTSFAPESILTILSKSNSKTCNTYTENVSTWNACLYMALTNDMGKHCTGKEKSVDWSRVVLKLTPADRLMLPLLTIIQSTCQSRNRELSSNRCRTDRIPRFKRETNILRIISNSE